MPVAGFGIFGPQKILGLPPARSTPGAWPALDSAPDAPIRGLLLSYSLGCLGCFSPWHRVLRLSNPSSRAHASLLCGLWGRHEGTRGGRLLPGCGTSGVARSPTRDHSSFRACGRGLLPAGRGCGVRSWGPAVLGTLSHAAVRRVLCALPGFAAPGGRFGLAPVLVPWLWPAACLSGVPRGPALVRRSSSGLVALGAPVGFPVALVPSPTPGAVAPGFTGWLRAARGGRPRTGLIAPAAGPCRGKGAGRAPRRTRSGPRDEVVPRGSLRLRSWAACAAVVRRVWTRSLTRPVSRSVCLMAGDSAVHRGRFLWTPTPPLLGRRTPRQGPAPCVCACSSWPGRAGRPPGRVLGASPFLLAVLGVPFASSAPSGQELPRWWLLLGFFFFPFPLPPPLLRPRCVLLCVFSGPGCLWPWRLGAPPIFFFPPPPPSVCPSCLLFFVFSGLGCLGPRALVAHPPPPARFCFCFLPRSPLLSLAFPAFRLHGPMRPPPPFSFIFCIRFFLFFSACCVVRGGFVRLRLSGVPACASVVVSLSLLCVRWLLLCGFGCWAWLSFAVSRCVLVSCFGGAVLVWPRGSPPHGSAWCVLVFLCPVLCCDVVLCGQVVVCCRALLFVCVVACACCLFLAAACLLCVFWGVLLSVPCPLRPVPCCAALCWCPFVVLCASSVLFLVAPLVGSRCRYLLFGVCWWLWLPGIVVWWCVSALVPVSGLAGAWRLPCGVLLPCAVSCGAVLPCGSVLWCPFFSFFGFLLAGGAGFLLFPVGSGLPTGSGSFLFLCSACAVLCWCACLVALWSVLSCPRGAGWCFVLLPVVFVCLLLGLAVLCCLLVGPGGSWCRVSVACCGVSPGAVLRRAAARCAASRCVVVRCVVSFCSVWCCRVLCCVLGRCPSCAWSA